MEDNSLSDAFVSSTCHLKITILNSAEQYEMKKKMFKRVLKTFSPWSEWITGFLTCTCCHRDFRPDCTFSSSLFTFTIYHNYIY